MTFSPGERAAASQPLPYEQFRAELLPAQERFGVWRDAVLPLFDCFPDPGAARSFTAELEGYDLQRTFASLCSFSPLHFRRGQDHRSRESIDHLLVQLYLQGGYVGRNGGVDVRVGAGDISLLDLGLPLATEARASRVLSFVIPRELFRHACGRQQWVPGAVLRAGSPMATILANHMLTVWESLRHASMRELEAINRMLVGVVAGAFATPAPAFHALPERSLFDAICAHIQDNLESRTLTPAHLCRRFNCSRSQLYRMFLPVGGVAAFIRRERLERCRDELMSGRQLPGHVFDVALRWGFDNQSHFCRLFRRTFGMTPGDALNRGRQLQALRPLTRPSSSRTRRHTPAFHHWIRQLRCA